MFEPLQLPPKLDDLLWLDFTDPTKDAENAAVLAGHIRSADATDARRRRGFRSPPDRAGRHSHSPRNLVSTAAPESSTTWRASSAEPAAL